MASLSLKSAFKASLFYSNIALLKTSGKTPLICGCGFVGTGGVAKSVLDKANISAKLITFAFIALPLFHLYTS